MTIEAKVIAHSSHPGCPDLITLQLKYPRFIHSEFMTHRVFSRNASSSRAIPVKRMIQDVLDDPAMPIEWGSNKPGMQAGSAVDDDVEFQSKHSWIRARDYAVREAEYLASNGLHKQIVNRILEPFQHISVVCTATDWDNFFALRDHEAAQPEIRELARQMRKAIEISVASGDKWHLPYVTNADWYIAYREGEGWDFLASISAARCARVSYLNHDGSKADITKDLELASMLRAERHASPFEHQARPTPGERHANLNGWKSYRSELGI